LTQSSHVSDPSTAAVSDDEAIYLEPGAVAFSLYLAELAADQFESPWRTLWRPYEYVLLRVMSNWKVLPAVRRAKLKRQVARRDPRQYFMAVRALQADQSVTARLIETGAQQSSDFRPYDPALTFQRRM
jgi:hypothetical protein